jgi:hypothetical protein
MSDLARYRHALLQSGERRQRLAFGLLAIAVVAIVVAAVVHILR